MWLVSDFSYGCIVNVSTLCMSLCCFRHFELSLHDWYILSVLVLSKLQCELLRISYFWIGFDSQLEEDELLARAIQESLNVESPPRHGNGNTYQPVPPPRYGNGNGNTYEPVPPPRYGNGNTYQPIPMYYPMGSRYIIIWWTTVLSHFGANSFYSSLVLL